MTGINAVGRSILSECSDRPQIDEYQCGTEILLKNNTSAGTQTNIKAKAGMGERENRKQSPHACETYSKQSTACVWHGYKEFT